MKEYNKRDRLTELVAEANETEIRCGFLINAQAVTDHHTASGAVVPPCKVGDTAYFIINGEIYKTTICYIQFCQRETGTITEIRGSINASHSVSAEFSEWGKTVFPTYKEAEQALNGVESNE